MAGCDDVEDADAERRAPTLKRQPPTLMSEACDVLFDWPMAGGAHLGFVPVFDQKE